MRIAEAGEQRGDPLEAEDVAAGRERGQPVELGLDGGVGGGAVGHSPLPRSGRGQAIQAAFFAGSAAR